MTFLQLIQAWATYGHSKTLNSLSRSRAVQSGESYNPCHGNSSSYPRVDTGNRRGLTVHSRGTRVKCHICIIHPCSYIVVYDRTAHALFGLYNEQAWIIISGSISIYIFVYINYPINCNTGIL